MIRVIGLGSPFGDDQAGWWVADRLREQNLSGIDIVTLDRPGAALIDWFRDCNHVILIDALVDGGDAGRVVALDPDLLPGQRPLTSHQLAISETLALAEALDCRPACVEIYGVTIQTSDQVHAEVRHAAERLGARLSARLGSVRSVG
ncbi:MAG: hydrogenase maturation protease [Gammaproteobacteria bacterium]|nr:hydrogenase maturation protease [Gammaproteobacteria bacterium]